jgi:hypothetical protein
MTFEQIVTVVALVLGPLLAVAITLFAQHLNNVRAQRLWIFQTLMAFRMDAFNAERIKALALIDVAFHNVASIRQKWKEYYEALNNPIYKEGQNNAVNAWNKKQNVMLAEMAQFLGYGKQIGYEEIERAYAPMLFANNAARGEKLATEVLRVLENSENLGEPRKRDGDQPKK